MLNCIVSEPEPRGESRRGKTAAKKPDKTAGGGDPSLGATPSRRWVWLLAKKTLKARKKKQGSVGRKDMTLNTLWAIGNTC